MKIGIIGAGKVGTGLGRRLAAAGHDIVVSFGRSPDKVAEAAAAIGGKARPGTTDEAAQHGEVVIIATLWGVTLDTVRPLAATLAGTIVWDATNPLKADMSGLEIGTTTSAGESVQAALPEARVVKAVPPFAEVLHSPSTLIDGRRPGVFVCGDDEEARLVIVRLISGIDAEAVNAGPLALARYTEPLGMLLVQLAYKQGMGARIGSVLIRDAAAASPY